MAWWVVVGHALNLGGIKSEFYTSVFMEYFLKLLSRGTTAVHVFIIISGFVIAHLLISKKEGYYPYIKRRWLRIFPVFSLVAGSYAFLTNGALTQGMAHI